MQTRASSAVTSAVPVAVPVVMGAPAAVPLDGGKRTKRKMKKSSSAASLMGLPGKTSLFSLII